MKCAKEWKKNYRQKEAERLAGLKISNLNPSGALFLLLPCRSSLLTVSYN